MANCERKCFMIGGPWIAEDPDCPIHGFGVQDRGLAGPKVARVKEWVAQLQVRGGGKIWDPENETYVALGRAEIIEAVEVLHEMLHGRPLGEDA